MIMLMRDLRNSCLKLSFYGRMSLLSIVLFLSIQWESRAQVSDSLALTFRQLGEEDLLEKNSESDTKVLSGSRTLSGLKDLPYTVYIVTKKQIQQLGYITLVDVLRSLPGIRVSQPGSALNGETFLMRGLLGNQYTKILINDLPIRPSATGGMPIGAQLPIQQAERIEITFGALPGIYGADAMGGTINIVTQQTDRPFYVQADVSLGVNAFDQLSVSLGGKVGRDRHVISFNIFGIYTEVDERPLAFDQDSLYLPSGYNRDNVDFTRFDNYTGTKEKALIRNFVHSSDAIGARMTYRDFYANFEQYDRRDHSALGLNPVHMSLANPVNTTGETITRVTAGWKKDWERWKARIDATNIDYELQPRSSSAYVIDVFNRGVQSLAKENTGTAFANTDFEGLADNLYDQYLSGLRYRYARSEDWYIDPMVSYKPVPYFSLTLGANLLWANAQPFTDYLPFSYFKQEGSLLETVGASVSDIILEEQSFNNVGAYAQLSGEWKSLTYLGAVRYDNHSQFGQNFNTTFAALWQFEEETSLRINFSNASQTPSAYFQARSYEVAVQPDQASARLATPNFERESNRSFEVGLRSGRGDNFETDIAYFQTTAQNLLAYGVERNIEPDNLLYFEGYRNDFNSTLFLRGFQGRLRIGLFDGTDGYFNFQRAKGTETLPYTEEEIEEVRGVGKWTWQIQTRTRFRRKWFIQTVQTFSQAWQSRNWNGQESEYESARIPKYYTLDVIFRYQLNNEFQGFVQALNTLNREYAGIAVGRLEDDLAYNPQHLRSFRVGLNYSMR